MWGGLLVVVGEKNPVGWRSGTGTSRRGNAVILMGHMCWLNTSFNEHILSTAQTICCFIHFTDEETKLQRYSVLCPWSHGQQTSQLGSEYQVLQSFNFLVIPCRKFCIRQTAEKRKEFMAEHLPSTQSSNLYSSISGVSLVPTTHFSSPHYTTLSTSCFTSGQELRLVQSVCGNCLNYSDWLRDGQMTKQTNDSDFWSLGCCYLGKRETNRKIGSLEFIQLCL